MILADHIEFIECICEEYGKNPNRLYYFNEALRFSRIVEAKLSIELFKLNILCK
jgi:hypothetical protein